MKPWQQDLPLGDAAGALPRSIDVYICSASFESRCRSIANAIADNVKIGKAFICFNQKSAPSVRKNARYLEEKLGAVASLISLDRLDPISSADALHKDLEEPIAGKGSLSYLIDITTFTHESLLILLKILQPRFQGRSNVILAYAPASEYSVGLNDEQKWLSRGISDIRSVLGYPGTMKASGKSHLIVLVGFESDRAEKLIDAYEPNLVSLGYGLETDDIHYTVNRRAFSALVKRFSNSNPFEFSCEDVALAQQAILQQISKFPNHNVIIAPMNTKLSTASVAGIAFQNPEIQLCYARALRYNVQGYSSPGTTCILVKPPRRFWGKSMLDRA